MSATMTLHWSPRSPYVRKVMIAAHELGLADRLRTVRTVVGGTAPHRELMRDNPLGKIPTLVLKDGVAVYDSPVICEYLDTLHDGPKLYPPWPARLTALRRQALGDGILDVALGWLSERLRPAERQSRRTSIFGGRKSWRASMRWKPRLTSSPPIRSPSGISRSAWRWVISISASPRSPGGRTTRACRNGRPGSISAHRCAPTFRWMIDEQPGVCDTFHRPGPDCRTIQRGGKPGVSADVPGPMPPRLPQLRQFFQQFRIDRRQHSARHRRSSGLGQTGGEHEPIRAACFHGLVHQPFLDARMAHPVGDDQTCLIVPPFDLPDREAGGQRGMQHDRLIGGAPAGPGVAFHRGTTAGATAVTHQVVQQGQLKLGIRHQRSSNRDPQAFGKPEHDCVRYQV